MMVTSILSAMMFSLLAAYLTMANITRSSTSAYIEGNSTFYAAESGLNKRAEMVRQRFLNYAQPDGSSPAQVAGQPVTIENMLACLDNDISNDGAGDFGCRQITLNYQQAVKSQKQGSAFSDRNGLVKYIAHSFVTDRTVYVDPVRKIPTTRPIPAGQAYEGLNAQEYRYTVYSTATTREAQNLDAKAMTVLEMTFKSRLIPLFQFAAFYDGDLELNSTSQMNINGRLHTNGALYSQPTPLDKKGAVGTANTKLLGPVTAADRIFNRVDASTVKRFGDTAVLITGDPNNPNDPANTYKMFPEYAAGRTSPFTPTEIAEFQGRVRDELAGAMELKVPRPDFLRKYDQDNTIGEYYGKADLRLEMFPKRTAGNVPFNFAAIKNGGAGGSCSGFSVSNTRQGEDLKCTQLNEGQLRSLQQPVMVKVVSEEERQRFCPTITKTYNSSSGGSNQKLRSLQIVIAAQNNPVTWSQLNSPVSNLVTSPFWTFILSLLSINTSESPNQIAANEGACFVPAPIQVVSGSGTANSNYNWQSGYYDRREKRWIGMLQTNLESLTLWNRDGFYVARDNDLTTNDAPTSTSIIAAYNGGAATSAYDTKHLLFIPAPANNTAPVGSFQKLGLAAADTTEGGLVFHATVSEDLDGNGTKDITVDPADNLHNYPNGKKKSPYGFVFNGGRNLPGALSVVTDQALYVQGDYNTFANNVAKQPAALIGDTITILSNSCLDTTTTRVNCGVTTGQKVATTTSVNAAFLSYTDESIGNVIDLGNGSWGWGQIRRRVYSGGLNNYMRMTENWSGIDFNYRGSFVSLGPPQEFSGEYQSGCTTDPCYYMVPNRNFSYDTDFNAVDKLPPLTPKVTYLQQEVFKRSYN
jgi:hypothetical protein